MKKRLCFVSPDVEHAVAVVQHLEADGLPRKNIYALGPPDLPMERLPGPGPERDDFMPAFIRGVTFGAVGGLLIGLVVLAFAPSRIEVGAGGVLLLGLLGASVGGLGTGISGLAFPSSRLAPFANDIEAGRIVVMVDVPKDRVERVNALIRRLDPDVNVEGVEPPPPVIPP
ncbi:DUF1269 domain-containing protein [Wenzhouxiangella sp. XN24]|uniref:DUF1269 domain-containing protein n=1 Tax=Wenzhouxiangella sp. XN24 TaxID=2713569 RepID=UPI0013ECF1B0|nr:DUF1269 domain-containing protein [Wenzhouxiangella sp. XN24]NGX15362.1 DUF1269 domain-containing protein [Wenzhouxiangella sp. XN24]